MNIELKNTLFKAVKLAQAGEWEASHRIVQEYNDAIACWIHAVLHKIQGDEVNSRYWYARCNARFEDHADASQELEVIEHFLI